MQKRVGSLPDSRISVIAIRKYLKKINKAKKMQSNLLALQRTHCKGKGRGRELVIVGYCTGGGKQAHFPLRIKL